MVIDSFEARREDNLYKTVGDFDVCTFRPNKVKCNSAQYILKKTAFAKEGSPSIEESGIN